jgi:tetratricopeptide (TPR) repeat protein
VQVLELGAGLGLFARYFLDAFRTLCEQEATDFYQRLTYFVTDEATRSVEHWQQVGLFANHASHVVLGVCNASAPQQVTSLTGHSHCVARLQAVLCNYILDVLPASNIELAATGAQELCVRTHLSSDAALVAQYTALVPADIAALAASDDPASREQLLPLLTLLEPELGYRPITRAIPRLEAALALAETNQRFLFNHGAVHCLEQCLPLLDPQGFVLINDYGQVGTAPGPASLPQRFGASSANGINFPLFETMLAQLGYCTTKPAGDDEVAIHARLFSLQRLPAMEEVFTARFGKQASTYFNTPVEEARAHTAAGRKHEALESYKTALSRQARNWSLIGEAAEFTAMHLRDYAAGLELCGAALELNPCYSSWLWNVMGDCLYCMNRYPDAHEAYLHAAAINARDPRTQLNLAYTYHLRGEFDAALAAIAKGFAADGTAVYRDRLYERLQQTLAAISARTQGERERLLARQARVL